MDMIIPTWTIDLTGPPVIRLLTFASHGRTAVEHYDVGCWALHFYQYHAQMELDGLTVPITPRHIGVTPPGVHMTYRFSHPDCQHLVALFHLPEAGTERYTIPAMQPGGSRFEAAYDSLGEVVHLQQMHPARAVVRLWDVLHRVAALADQQDDSPALVEAVASYINRHLEEPLRVGDLAARFRVSRNHLTRQFRAVLGCTVIVYIHRRRSERALDLLRHSDLSITDIATMLGFPDLQRFNKFIRAMTGVSPSAHR